MTKMKRSLEEKVAQAKAMHFNMPEGITLTKTRLPDGIWAYVFRHHEMGELGRVIILPHSDERSQFVCEVVGEPDDPMTKVRQKILEPITKDLLGKVSTICGPCPQEKCRPYTLQKPQHCIESKVMPCEQCGLPTALLIFAEGATTADELADYARLMFKKVKELNVPT